MGGVGEEIVRQQLTHKVRRRNMRTLLVMGCLLVLPFTGWAGEFTNRFPEMTLLNGARYENVRPQRFEGTNLVIFHSRGISVLPRAGLPDPVLAALGEKTRKQVAEEETMRQWEEGERWRAACRQRFRELPEVVKAERRRAEEERLRRNGRQRLGPADVHRLFGTNDLDTVAWYAVYSDAIRALNWHRGGTNVLVFQDHAQSHLRGLSGEPYPTPRQLRYAFAPDLEVEFINRDDADKLLFMLHPSISTNRLSTIYPKAWAIFELGPIQFGEGGSEAEFYCGWQASPGGGEGFHIIMSKQQDGRWIIKKKEQAWIL